MASICIFCPNSINIVAGINGIEVGQSVVIALLILSNDLLYLLSPVSPGHPATDAHRFSLHLLLPFLGVSAALLKHNWYPARVFVGDTYCYFAGMVFAIDAILGHWSKTLLLLFLPQIFNFVYSAPQLFGLVPCPRHRLPRFNPQTGLLGPSMAHFGGSAEAAKQGPKHTKPLRRPVQVALKALSSVGLVKVEIEQKTGQVVQCSNLTILNLWLVWFGPMREERLALSLLAMQFACGLCGLFVRHRLALLIFTVDNL